MAIKITLENNICVCCGKPVPEGHQVCMACETAAEDRSSSLQDSHSGVQEDIVITARSNKTPFLRYLKAWNRP